LEGLLSRNFIYTKQDYDETVSTGAFTTDERDDDLITVDIKLSYALTKYLSVDAKYQYNRRDSNAGAFDYNNNVFTLGLALEV